MQEHYSICKVFVKQSEENKVSDVWNIWYYKAMKLSAWVFATDLIPHKRSYFDKWVKSNIFDEYSVEEVFKKLKSSGIDGIELLIPLHFTEEDAQYIEKTLSENTVKVNSIHQPLRLFSKSSLDEVESLFVLAKRLSAKVIVLHLSSSGNQIHDKNYLSSLRKWEKEYNVKLGFENHQKHFVLFYKKYLWDSKQFSTTMKKLGFGITFDTTHLATTGADIIKFLQENLDTVVNIHISDYKDHPFSTSFRPADFTHMPLGKGELPIKEFLQTLKKNNYKGLLTMEINTNLEGLCQSAKIILHKGEFLNRN